MCTLYKLPHALSAQLQDVASFVSTIAFHVTLYICLTAYRPTINTICSCSPHNAMHFTSIIYVPLHGLALWKTFRLWMGIDTIPPNALYTISKQCSWSPSVLNRYIYSTLLTLRGPDLTYFKTSISIYMGVLILGVNTLYVIYL